MSYQRRLGRRRHGTNFCSAKKATWQYYTWYIFIYRLSHPDINLGMMIHSTWIPEIQEGKYPEAERKAARKLTLDRD